VKDKVEPVYGVGGQVKYIGEQDSRHGGALIWPGYMGFPFRGKPELMTEAEQQKNIRFVSDAKNYVFDLSKKEDKEYYQWVQDRIQNGLFQLVYIERHWDPDKKNMYIYMEWNQIYAHCIKQ